MKSIKKTTKEILTTGILILAAILVPGSAFAHHTGAVAEVSEDSVKQTLLAKLIYGIISPEKGLSGFHDYSKDERVLKIKSYFDRYNLPAADHAEDFVFMADVYGVDWRLVPAIAMIESTGFKHACSGATFSGLGWGSCKIDFNSYRHGISVVTYNLAGKNPNTEYYYAGKDLYGILDSYNPPTIRPDYKKIVTGVMKDIDEQNVKIAKK